MQQGRFWGRRARFSARPRRVKKVALSERGIYEPVEIEENVVEAVMTYLWRCGIPVFRHRERVPVCWKCKAKVCKPSDAGYPDLSGYVPVTAALRWAINDQSRAWRIQHMKYPIPFYIEAKRPKGGRVRPAQTIFIMRAIADGALAFIARSVADVRKEFTGIGIVLPGLGLTGE